MVDERSVVAMPYELFAYDMFIDPLIYWYYKPLLIYFSVTFVFTSLCHVLNKAFVYKFVPGESKLMHIATAFQIDPTSIYNLVCFSAY